MRIVIRTFAERIHGGAGEARIQATGGQVGVVLQCLLKFAAVHTQIGLEQVGHRQACIFMQLFGY